jgi:uncharacterized membrane protein
LKIETKISGAVFAAIPVVMLIASIVCTWAIANGAPSYWKLPFRIACHGIPSRCLALWGTKMPICARCTAIYIGLFAGVVLFMLFAAVRTWRGAGLWDLERDEKVLRTVMFAAALPLAIDGITQALRLRESTNDLRLVTGMLAGVTFGVWVLSAVERPARRVFRDS